MTFLLLLLAVFALLWIPPLARLARAPGCRDKMRVGAGVAFIIASLPHFLAPERYLPMMPPFVVAPEAMIFISGMGEMLGGLGLLLPQTARLAAWGLVVLLVAVFPANLWVAINGVNAAGLPSSPWYTWSRLPLQLVFIWWVLASVKMGASPPRRSGPTGRTGATGIYSG